MKACHFLQQPSLLCSSTIGSGLRLNREHRRVNSKAAGRELSGKHWFPSQPSTSGSHFKELFAQFCAEVAPQSLANFRVRCIHFLTRQCAAPISICQSICERLSCLSDFFGEQIEQLNAFQERLFWIFNRA